MAKILSVELIVRGFVSEAFKLAKIPRTVGDFEERWYDYVSKETGISRGDVVFLHNPVWWTLISARDSPLEYIQATNNGDKPKIGLRDRRELLEPDIEGYVREIISEHREWYEARIKNLLQAA